MIGFSSFDGMMGIGNVPFDSFDDFKHTLTHIGGAL
jgi:hypothetical protein